MKVERKERRKEGRKVRMKEGKKRRKEKRKKGRKKRSTHMYIYTYKHTCILRLFETHTHIHMHVRTYLQYTSFHPLSDMNCSPVCRWMHHTSTNIPNLVTWTNTLCVRTFEFDVLNWVTSAQDDKKYGKHFE